MKKIFIAACMFIMAFAASAQKTIVKDDNAVARTLNAPFHAIKISGGIDLYLSQYESESVAVSASEPKYRDNIKTVVENGVLRIYYDNNGGWNTGNKKMKAYVSFKTLDHLHASGACDVQVAGTIQVPSLSMEMSGASDFKGALAVTNLSLDLSGASDVKVSGTATEVNIESSGASDVKAYDLITDVCHAKASGASDINITVNKEITANASGASDIFYKGNCTVKEVHSSGASTIARR